MTVSELRKLLNDTRLTEDSEVRIGVSEQLNNCGCQCCADDDDVAIMEGAVGVQVGAKRALVLRSEQHLFQSVPSRADDGIEEGDE